MGVNITNRILGEAKAKRPLSPTTRRFRATQEDVAGVLVVTDPQAAYHYAKDVINGRFPEGEAAIAKNTRWSYYYARDVIKGRWPRGEAAIANDPQDAYFAYQYAKDVLKGRFPGGEEALAKDTYYAPLYATNIVKGRWPEGEEAIATSTPEVIKSYLEKCSLEAKLEWVMNGWIDWLDL